jgi:putative membrane protein
MPLHVLAYKWVVAFHVIAFTAWMAAMFYLPRLFVYHCDAEKGSKQSETFKVMERRLLGIIAWPAAMATWGSGAWLALIGGHIGSKWFLAKLALVVVMSMMHGLNARWVEQFARDRNRHTARFYRIVNEVPTILLIGIVVLVIVKPF